MTGWTARDDLALAHVLADVAQVIAVEFFQRRELPATNKSDGSPVTEADRRIEAAMRSHLLRRRPDDVFIGEESGVHGGGGRRWYVDPIDGTASFLAGQPEWSTLIGVADTRSVAVGLVAAPALQRRWWASRAGGAWTRGYGGEPYTEPTRLSVSPTRRLALATVAVWPVAARHPEPLRAPVTRLLAACAEVRPRERSGGQPPAKPSTGTGTCHGALLVATGQVDAFVLTGGGPWDLAAAVPIVEEAGGRFSDGTGGRDLNATTAVFTNGFVHDQVLHYLRPGSATAPVTPRP